ncbi:terminase large subunit [Amycolatopsis sp. MJM2582]|uniref:terminase large subunit n=1 Tax=Amycolatopsis sp. MJM2582 TaxID=1427749 RepID=UPI00068CAB1E|nr:terminase large subunit [Amycolatopsis sp. MJM2582]
MIFDEVLTQPNGDLWAALCTGMGTRVQPLLLAATTAGNDPTSFAKSEHDECVKIAENPSRAPHRFVYLRNLPAEAAPRDELNWYCANPALGDFLSLAALREEALEARNDPGRETSFRQYG